MNIRTLTLLTQAGLLACWTFAVSAQNASGPTQITTTDGHTYHNAIVQSVEPDGLLVRYTPDQGGLGMATLKFRNLPDNLRNQYGYDEQKANAYEQDQAKANAQWRSQTTAANSAANWFQHYRALAELNRSLAGDGVVSYTATLDPNGRVAAQGFTGGVLPYNMSYYPGLLPYNFNSGQQQQQQSYGGASTSQPEYGMANTEQNQNPAPKADR